MKGIKQDKGQNKTRKIGNPKSKTSTTTVSKAKPMFSAAKNKNKDLLASLSDPELCAPVRPSSSTKEIQDFKKRTLPTLKRTGMTKCGSKLENRGSTINKEAMSNGLDDEIHETPTAWSDKPSEKREYESKCKFDEIKEGSKLTSKKLIESNVTGYGERNCKFDDGSESFKKLSWKSKLKKKNDNVVQKPTLKNNTTEACTGGGSSKISCTNEDEVTNISNGKSKFKPNISLKPVSKLTESPCFGNSLENIEKTS